ncbi:unnamed protein product [Owenia fusiformis]|uniref:Uncharacterized protein n=1 Tax=Owenia fusiformis TaxID=6347 RepID=A0A8J1Y1X1_OWEFU|nr:unnamed protein product [Owenia fusiformis]
MTDLHVSTPYNPLSHKPIGYVRSLFAFKNGTPRQASVCTNAKAVIAIEKSVFNNPEHSLQGLEAFSHVWVIFLFHKNNNSHRKAKVAPPRLNGAKVGVFSTRSPYRPNPIGLSLCRVAHIEGNQVHLSGIDMLDGTPVLDIKPYIPQYDAPVLHEANSNEDTVCSPNERVYEPQAIPSIISGGQIDLELEKIQISVKSTSGASVSHSHQLDLKSGQSQTSTSNSSASNCHLSEIQSDSNSSASNCHLSAIESDLNSSASNCHLSAIESDLNSSASNCHLSEIESDLNSSASSCHLSAIESDLNSSASNCHLSRLESDQSQTSTSDSSFSNCDLSDSVSNKSQISNSNSSLSNKPSVQSDKSDSISSVDSSGQLSIQSDKSQTSISNSTISCSYQSEKPNEKICLHDIDESIKSAQWITSPPIDKLRVCFTGRAKSQLQKFSLNATGNNLQDYFLNFFDSSDQLEQAICEILQADPRSSYRRKNCTDSLYYFCVDNAHVTCWFDGDMVEVVKVKPISNSILAGKT